MLFLGSSVWLGTQHLAQASFAVVKNPLASTSCIGVTNVLQGSLCLPFNMKYVKTLKLLQ